MKKYIIALFLITASIVFAADNLWEYYNGILPSIEERAVIYSEISEDIYTGAADQNISLLSYLEPPKLGALAFPPSTVEGTSTAGWTDDGSIVRLNTTSDTVGIGTTNPSEKLDVVGNVTFSGTTFSGGDISIQGGDINLGNGSATTTITSSGGLLGIGTTTPTEELSVHGETFITGTTTTGVLEVASSTTKINGVTYSWPSSQGASGERIENDGSGGLSWTAASAGTASSTIITTTGTTTWAIPSGITRVKVTLLGGGGGGGGVGNGSGDGGGGGGGGGGYAIEWVDVTGGTNIQVFVGAGGAGGTAGANDGSGGGDTTFIATSTAIRANGGSGGGNSSGATDGAGGAGGTTSVNIGFGLTGMNGGAGLDTIDEIFGGKGGNSPLGEGAPLRMNNNNGASGQGKGAGGSGGADNTTTIRAGGVGTAGIAIIEWIES